MAFFIAGFILTLTDVEKRHARGHFGLVPDASRACHFYARAAAEGDAAAQYNLGLCFLVGDGVRLNKNRAAKWFRAAAAQDFPPGVHNLAAAYAYGTGVPKDLNKAIDLFARAADLGDPNAAFCLSQCYRSGSFGQRVDVANARRYLHRASQLGHKEAAAQIANGTAW